MLSNSHTDIHAKTDLAKIQVFPDGNEFWVAVSEMEEEIDGIGPRVDDDEEANRRWKSGAQIEWRKIIRRIIQMRRVGECHT